MRVQRTTDGWTVLAKIGPHKSTSAPFGTPQEAFFEAGDILTRTCKELVSQMKWERRSSGQHPTPIQWDLFRAANADYDLQAFRKLSRTGAQQFLQKAFGRKFHATAGPPSLARNPYLKPSIESGKPNHLKQASLQAEALQPTTKERSGGYSARVGESRCDFSGKHVLLFRNLQNRAFECPLCCSLVRNSHPQFEGFKEHVNVCCIAAKKAGGKGCPVCECGGKPS